MEVRLANILDPLDGEVDRADQEVAEIDLEQLAKDLFVQANGNLDGYKNVIISEKSLTGNQDFNQMKKKRIHWKATDDLIMPHVKPPKDKSNTVISLERQRIRVFDFHYKVVEAAQMEVLE